MSKQGEPFAPNPVQQSSRSDAVTVLKRPASTSFDSEGLQENTCRKRIKGDTDESTACQSKAEIPSITNNNTEISLVEELAQELQCGCCSELVYRPVVVAPCQHFFCGSCCVLWINNGGANCPACRGVSTMVTPSRPLESILEVFLRAAPHKARAAGERAQADELYKYGTSLSLPTPREASPEPNLDINNDYAQPCPHCAAGNAYGWRCPQPVVDPNTDPDHAWLLEDGAPPGHSFCGNCENLLAVPAPSTTKCDLCQVFFCGIGVQGRCSAAPLISQRPHRLSDIGDLIQSSEVYECFDGNTIEVEIMFDYLAMQRLTPRHIYREIITHVQAQPRDFKPLIELDLFVDLHGVAPGIDPDPDAPRSSTCRLCATETLLWGLREWWIRERQKGLLDETVTNRADCPEGSGCPRQKEITHAREFNHIIGPRNEPAPEAALIPSNPEHPPAVEPIDVQLDSDVEPELPEPNLEGQEDAPVPLEPEAQLLPPAINLPLPELDNDVLAPEA